MKLIKPHNFEYILMKEFNDTTKRSMVINPHHVYKEVQIKIGNQIYNIIEFITGSSYISPWWR